MSVAAKSKKIIVGASIFILLIVALFVGFYSLKSKTLTSYEVFRDVDFKSQNANIDGVTINFDRENIYEEIELSTDEKTSLLKALEDSKFEKLEYASTYDIDYRMNITFNKRYEIYLDSKNKFLIFINGDEDSNHSYYKFSGESNFFKLLDASTKKTLTEK